MYYFYNYLDINKKVSSFLFVDSKNNQLTTSAVRRILINLRNKLGYTTLYPHYLRHTFATYFIIYGGDTLSLKIILGHTTLYMTEIYVHIAKQIALARNVKYTPLSNIPFFQKKRR